MASIIHCADLHLGAPFSGLPKHIAQKRRQDALNSLKGITRLCAEKKIELLLIAGDMFDNICVSPEILETTRDALASAEDTIVAIASGNHDAALIDSPYHKKNFWPPNVILFTGSARRVHLPALGVTLRGAGFSNVYQDETLLNKTEPDSGSVNIFLTHGEITAPGASSPYNPITLESVAASGMNYIALGHIHKRSEIKKSGETFYAWPGSLEPLGFDETGEHGVYIGNINQDGPDLEFLPASQRIYADWRVDMTGLSKDEIVGILREKIAALRGGAENLIRAVLTGYIENDILTTEYFMTALSDVFYLTVKDLTEYAPDPASLENEFDLRGLFVKKMRERINSNPGDDSLKLALKLGLEALR